MSNSIRNFGFFCIVLFLILFSDAQNSDPFKLRFSAQNEYLAQNTHTGYSYYFISYYPVYQLKTVFPFIVKQISPESAILRLSPDQHRFLTTQDLACTPADPSWKLGTCINRYVKAMSGPASKKESNWLDRHVIILKTTGKVDFESFGVFGAVQLQENIYKLSIANLTYLPELIQIEEVVYVDVYSWTPVVESRVLDQNLNINRVNKVHKRYPNLLGSNLTLSIQENRYDTTDFDLRNRHISSSLQAETIDNHATAMATISGGAGNTSIKGLGVARDVKLISSSFENILPDPEDYYILNDITVQNHSYGTGVSSFYGAAAELYDRRSYDISSLLHVFSAGNSKEDSTREGLYKGLPGFANLTGDYKLAKNVLTVGAVDTAEKVVFFSSSGPAFDGRIKPELVAFGQAGTSDAAAMVSGGAILLQDFFKSIQQEYASSDLIKALLINGAQDVGQPGLDHQTGYGNMNLDASMEMLAKGQFYQDIVSDSPVHTYDIIVPENTAQLKVSLVWIDPPAPAGSDLVLMNDLDMVLEDPRSRTYFPQVLNTFPDPDSLLLPAVEGEDHLNNIEQIIINNPSSGPMQVKLEASRMATSEQSFTLAFQFVENESWTWDFPVNRDNIPYDGESDTYFRWRSTLSAAQGRLEYSLNGGLDWTTIAESIALEKGLYRWTAPEVSGPAIARMVVGNEVYLTEPFVISRTPEIAVGLDCADTLQIRWEPVAGATNYRFFNLGDTNLALYQETSENGIVLQKAEVDPQVFAVQPVFPGGALGIRSPALSTSLNEGSCYITYSFALTEVEGVGLYLGLGTRYGVDEIRILRLDANGGESQIQMFTSSQLENYFLDRSASEGLNEYQVEVRLTNGEALRTEILRAVYLSESAFQLAPNPIARGDLLRIRAREFPSEGSTFRVFDQVGRQVWIRGLTTNEDQFETNTLEPGIYIYRIDTDTEKMTGKFVVIEK